MSQSRDNEPQAVVAQRHIIHADLDAFYAAVEQLDNPEFRGKPLLIGGSPDSRGVVATASYEARVFGVHSAMPMRTAVRLCPQGIVVRPRFGRYRELSNAVMGIFRNLTGLVEPMSLDEAYLDISQLVLDGKPPLAVALDLKEQVKEVTGLIVSVGVGASKSVTKIASDLRKPDGLVVIAPGDEAEFLAPLSVGKLWGIGPKTAERLHREGIETIGQLAERPLGWYVRFFGLRAASIRDKAQGRDLEPVHTERATKSVSAETTFAEDLADPEELFAELAKLSNNVARHLEGKSLRGRTVTVKLRLADFTTFTRQTTLPAPTSSPSAIEGSARRLLERELDPDRSFRLMGVGVSNFDEPDHLQLPLFEDDGPGVTQSPATGIL